MIIKKYIFSNEQKANELIDVLGVDTDENDVIYQTHKNHIVKLGYIVLDYGEFDQEGNSIKAPKLSDKFHVDILWLNKDDSNISSLSEFEINIDDEGVHKFYGINYLDNK